MRQSINPDFSQLTEGNGDAEPDGAAEGRRSF